MFNQSSLDRLWGVASPSKGPVDLGQLSEIPESARRYLEHAIAPDTKLASAVRLQLHGQIKLKGWYPFSAEEVIVWNRGFIWRATVRMKGICIRGSDRFLGSEGVTSWKVFGVVPVVAASGPDITRSAAGRVNIESIWLPSALISGEVVWEETDGQHVLARFSAHGESAQIDYGLGQNGCLKSVNMRRWGNPGGLDFGYYNCGGSVEEEATFGGYTIPTRMRVGWHFGTDRFEKDGEFFRVTIDNAVYR
jgi:hypothetical protein